MENDIGFSCVINIGYSEHALEFIADSALLDSQSARFKLSITLQKLTFAFAKDEDIQNEFVRKAKANFQGMHNKLKVEEK